MIKHISLSSSKSLDISLILNDWLGYNTTITIISHSYSEIFIPVKGISETISLIYDDNISSPNK